MIAIANDFYLFGAAVLQPSLQYFRLRPTSTCMARERIGASLLFNHNFASRLPFRRAAYRKAASAWR